MAAGELEDDLAALGARPDQIAGLKDRGALGVDGPLEILPGNRGAVRLFLAVETQWTFAGQMGVAMGLDYRAVEAAMNMMRVPARDRPDLFARLRVLEKAAGAALRARAKRRGG